MMPIAFIKDETSRMSSFNRVILLCIVTVYGKTTEFNPRYRPSSPVESKGTQGQSSNVREGFVQPLDFNTFTQQFVGEDQDSQGFKGKTQSFSEDSKKSGAFQIPNSEFAPFPGPIFQNQKENRTGFVEPVQFSSLLDKETSTKTYKTNINPGPLKKPEPDTKEDQIPKATEGEDDDDEDYYSHPSKVQSYRHYKRPSKPYKSYSGGKSSYPPPHRKSNPAAEYYPIPKPKDVEMILPKEKVLFLPMVNGKPKPYDGYRAAPETEGYETYEPENRKESSALREKRLNEGEIIYGKPKIPLSELYHRHLKRSPAEYYGGIYPYYDYSDAKLSVSGETDPENNRGKKSSASTQKRKKAYPKKHRQRYRDKPYNPYKYPKDTTKNRKKEEDSQGYASGESSEEAEDESEETSEETKGDKPLYKYTYDNTFSIPQLEIKTYPYEKHLRDSKVEGSRRDESYDVEDNVDEYTAGYERYIKTLPSDLEAYFGSPEISEKFSVQATQNLENNKNCKKVENAPAKAEDGTEKPKEEAETQICYICSDPETGDNYEQCAYKSQPKHQKYFFGGTTSFQTNETAEPATYRYKRSTYDYPYKIDPYASEESEIRESKQNKESDDSFEEYYKKPKKKSKKYKKQKGASSNLYGKKYPKKRYEGYKRRDYDPYYASSSKRGRAAQLEQPPPSYDGPAYTYEGPEETYEGPSQHYEGPKETYEGPAEPYEGPINQEYYDTTDERIEDDEEEASNQETQSSPPKEKTYEDYHRQKPKKRQSYSSPYRSYKSPSYSDDEGYHDDSYRHDDGYSGDYRFGPEHFVDEGEPEDTKQNDQIKPTSPPKSEKRGPQKFSASEGRSAAATDRQEKEESIGEVKTYKNGDVCQKKRKEGMICMVCKNEKTAATYEQCQYSTKPKEKYYAYGSQKSYTTKNPEQKPEEDDSDTDQYPEKSDIVEKKILITTQSKVFGYDPVPTEGLAVAESNNSPYLLPRDLYGEYSEKREASPEGQRQNDTESRDFTESIERIEPRDGIEGLDEYLYDVDHEDSEKKATEDEKRSYKSYDDYFHDLFPEFAKSSDAIPESDEKEESGSERHLAFDPFSNIRKFHEENSEYPERYSKAEEEEEEEEEKDAEASRPEKIRLKDKESRIPPDFFLPYNEENHKKDLEKALGEFQNKDWSNCKKIVKKKLTCYQCVDKNGVNNEECMYVEASQPISKHLAYHEKKELKPEGQEPKNRTTEPSTEIAERPEKPLRRFRKAKNSPEDQVEVAESPTDSEYENSTVKGDFEGVERLSVEEPETTRQPDITTTELSPKRKAKKQKRHQKKRNKTIRNETTTERFEKIRKRKFPVKKFVEAEEAPTEGVQEGSSFGSRTPETAEDGSPTEPVNAALENS